MVRHLVGHLGQHQRTVIGSEQTVAPQLLDAGAAGDVVHVVFFFCHLLIVVLDGAGDEFRGIPSSGRGLVIPVLEQVTAGRELPEELCYQLGLLVCGGKCGFARIDTLHTVTGSGVLDVVAQVGGGFLTAALDVRALEDYARRCATPPRCFFSVLKILERLSSGRSAVNQG